MYLRHKSVIKTHIICWQQIKNNIFTFKQTSEKRQQCVKTGARADQLDLNKL